MKKDTHHENFTTVIYRFYKAKRLFISTASVSAYIICSIAVSYYNVAETSTFPEQFWYYFLIALQNISITLFSIFILDYLVSSHYNEQLKEDIAKILTNPSLTKDFIREEQNQQILKCSMDAILGERVSQKIEETILHNYQTLDKNCMRQNMYVHIKLSSDPENSDFFRCTFSVDFDVTGIDGQVNFVISHFNNKDDYEQYIDQLSGAERVLAFPFLMAKDSDKVNNNFEIKHFKENGNVVEPTIKDDLSSTYPIGQRQTDPIKISFEINTVLNKTENYLFEDVVCVCDRYHLSFNYEDSEIECCNCYCSYKESGLRIRGYKNQLFVDMDDIVLPGNLFIFIWKYQISGAEEQNKTVDSPSGMVESRSHNKPESEAANESDNPLPENGT